MAKESQIRRELLRIVSAIDAKEATPQHYERINAILLEYPHAATLLAEAVWLSAVLEHRGWGARVSELAGVKIVQEGVRSAPADLGLSSDGAQFSTDSSSAQGDQSSLSARTSHSIHGIPASGLSSFVVAMAVAASVAAMAWMGLVLRSPKADLPSAAAISGAQHRGSGDGSVKMAALLTGSSNCQWRSSADVLSVGSGLQRGHEVELIEGIAYFQCLNGVLARLEGPSVLDVTHDYQPRLLEGSGTFVLPWYYESSCVELPKARIFGGSAELGCFAGLDASEIHCFRGAIRVETADASQVFELAEGESVKISDDRVGEANVVFAASQESKFRSLQTGRDQLSIPLQYIESVHRSKPLGYWRFEELRDVDGETSIKNEMGPKYPLYVHGTVLPVSEPDNRCIEMGTWDREGYLYVKGPLPEIASESYSIECWLKLKHHQYSTIVALVKDIGNEWSWRHHAVLLEVGSPELVTRGYRFLHRVPPSSNWQEGVNCLSEMSYSVGKWQHVVIVKDKKEMRLYLDGVLNGVEHTSEESLPPNLRMIVGRAYKPTRGRAFMGRLDELCIYPRAIQATEIIERNEIIRKSMQENTELLRQGPASKEASKGIDAPSA